MKKLLTTLATLGVLMAANSANAEITKNERVLVVVSELTEHGPRDLRDLYSVLENMTRAIPRGILASEYSRTIGQFDRSATSANFVNVLRTLALDERVQAIDVVLSLHGSSNKLYFFEGEVRIANLMERLLRATTPAQRDLVVKLKKKLRLMYNLSCFGDSVNEDFISMGFDTSVGSIAVNANGEVEFPSFVALWRLGASVKDALAPTNNPAAIFAHDAPLVAAGNLTGNTMLQRVNSKKEIEGRRTINIESDPR
jgi:hypothetical protein